VGWEEGGRKTKDLIWFNLHHCLSLLIDRKTDRKEGVGRMNEGRTRRRTVMIPSPTISVAMRTAAFGERLAGFVWIRGLN
jgi:hypothetical protein